MFPVSDFSLKQLTLHAPWHMVWYCARSFCCEWIDFVCLTHYYPYHMHLLFLVMDGNQTGKHYKSQVYD